MQFEGLKLKRTWAEINLDNIKNNFINVRNIVGKDCKIMSVVKADAYGHGDKIVASELIDAGTDFFGVSNIEEALSLRRGGVKIPILILGYTPIEFANVLYQYNIIQTIYSPEYARKLSDEAVRLRIKVEAHLKIDTGMNRIGFLSDSEEEINSLSEVYNLPAIVFTGIFTHFSVSDDLSVGDQKYTRKQFDKFKRICDNLQEKGIDVGLRHCCNSGGVLNYPEMHLDMVRPGIIIYGLYPNGKCDKIELKPAMTLKSRVCMVKEILAGSQVSYGRTFTAPKKMRVATVCIGYADGYNRVFSNIGKMIINGKLASVIGRVCMDQLMIDVTDVENVNQDDEVIVFGGSNNPLDNVAKIASTINYEIVSSVGKRVPRLYIKNNREYAFIDYIASM